MAGQARIVAARLQQIGVASRLEDAPVAQDHEAIRVDDGREPVGDEERRSAADEPVERLLDERLAPGVERARGLTEDGRVLEERAGDRESLAPAAGEARGALADLRRVPLRDLHDGLVRAGRARRVLHPLLRGVGAPVGDDVTLRVVEEGGILHDDAEVPPQVALLGVAQVLAIDADASVGRVVEALKQRHERRLARAAGAHDAHDLAGLDAEADLPERVLESDISMAPQRPRGMRTGCDARKGWKDSLRRRTTTT